MRAILAAGLVALCLAAAPATRADEPAAASSTPVVVRADKLTHDQKNGIVEAIGNVEIAQGQRVLLADRVTYVESTDTVFAEGNVRILEPSGETLFADSVELRDEMKEGVIRNIRILLGNNERMAASGAVRTGGNRTEMRKAVYSPCKLCPNHPDRPPLWQLKAVRVVHDQRRQDIEYTDAFLELFGVPVAYMPFFSHPDPTVRRRSGFLTPSYGTHSQLGLMIETPYFFNLAPYRDLTLAPIFTSNEGVVMTGEYRERTHTGEYRFEASITRPDKRDTSGEPAGGGDIRGHIEGAGRFELASNAHWGFDVARTTDDTYLRRYGFDNSDTLTSRLFVEHFDDRNYAVIDNYAFQGLAVDDDLGETPIILPIADYNYINEDGIWGGRYTFDANLMNLVRVDGTDSRRISLTGGWQRDYLGPAGDIYTLTASLRGDAYYTSDVNNGESSGLTGRVVPLLSLDWRYPWMRRSGATRQVIEPMVKFSYSPQGGNPDEIPNEDSQDFEFDDTNLFSVNRFPGFDRVEGGPRVSYGVRLGNYGAESGQVTAVMGQSFRVKADDTFESGSGLDDNRSDFVGRVQLALWDFLDLAYRFRLDRDDFSSRRSEVDLDIGPEWLRIQLGFLSLDDAPAALTQIGRREELRSSARAEIGENWSFTIHNRRDLTNDAAINMGAGITYEDECLTFTTRIDRSFTQDRDVEPATTIQFFVKLKHLG